MIKKNLRFAAFIMLCSILFGLMFWVFYSSLEYYYIRDYFHSLIYHYPDSFLDSLIFNISPYSLYTRLLFLFGCIAGGGIVAFYVIRHLETEDALLKSEKELKAIIDSAFDAKVLIDQEGVILKLNDKAALYFKKTEEELIGGKIYDFLPSDRLDKRREQFENAIDSKAPVQLDEEFDNHFYRLIIYPVCDDRGKVRSIAITLRDITREKKAGEEIKKGHEYLALAMRSARITIWEQWEKEKKMIVIGPDEIPEDYEKKKQVNSYSQFWESVHPDDRDIIGNALKDHIEGKTAIYSALYRSRGPDGGWIWINSFGRVVEWDEEGNPERLIGVRVDVTNLHNYREAVIRANAKLNLLSEITRHDILNQLTAIRLSQEILLSGELIEKDTETWDLFEVIFKATSMIEKQISFTRDYQNLGISHPKWQKVSDVLKAIEMDANLMNITVSDKTADLEIYADPMFEKVLFNILDNSSRHGAAKDFRASYEVSGKGWILILEDDGCGIEEEAKERIFNRGYGKNTGVGLFLAKEILDITSIGIRETGMPGEGARFEILIPKGAFREARE